MNRRKHGSRVLLGWVAALALVSCHSEPGRGNDPPSAGGRGPVPHDRDTDSGFTVDTAYLGQDPSNAGNTLYRVHVSEAPPSTLSGSAPVVSMPQTPFSFTFAVPSEANSGSQTTQQVLPVTGLQYAEPGGTPTLTSNPVTFVASVPSDVTSFTLSNGSVTGGFSLPTGGIAVCAQGGVVYPNLNTTISLDFPLATSSGGVVNTGTDAWPVVVTILNGNTPVDPGDPSCGWLYDQVVFYEFPSASSTQTVLVGGSVFGQPPSQVVPRADADISYADGSAGPRYGARFETPAGSAGFYYYTRHAPSEVYLVAELVVGTFSTSSASSGASGVESFTVDEAATSTFSPTAVDANGGVSIFDAAGSLLSTDFVVYASASGSPTWVTPLAAPLPNYVVTPTGVRAVPMAPTTGSSAQAVAFGQVASPVTGLFLDGNTPLGDYSSAVQVTNGSGGSASTWVMRAQAYELTGWQYRLFNPASSTIEDCPYTQPLQASVFSSHGVVRDVALPCPDANTLNPVALLEVTPTQGVSYNQTVLAWVGNSYAVRGATITNYEVNFDYGGSPSEFNDTFWTRSFAAGGAQWVEFEYTYDGAHWQFPTVALRVTDSNGRTQINTVPVVLEPRYPELAPPVAILSVATSSDTLPATITAAWAGSYQVGGSITLAEIMWDWDSYSNFSADCIAYDGMVQLDTFCEVSWNGSSDPTVGLRVTGSDGQVAYAVQQLGFQ